MPRKLASRLATAAAVPVAPTLVNVNAAPTPAAVASPAVATAGAPAAPASAPRARRRALRAAVASPAVPAAPVAVAIEIDLAQRNAKEALAKAFPRPTSDRILKASPAHDAAVLAYIMARETAAIAEGQKERAGNELRYAIKGDLGIDGDGYAVTWKEEAGGLDVGALLKHLNVPADLVAQFQRPSKRVLRVVETATAAEVAT